MNSDTPQSTVKESLTVQKPRCPVPYHLWKKEWKGVFVDIDGSIRAEIITQYGFSYPALFFDAEGIPVGTKWTRPEALESQMLPAPDRDGVWAIYRNEKYHCVVWIADLSIQNWQSVYEKYTFGWDINSVFQFYYMGLLPESEVQP